MTRGGTLRELRAILTQARYLGTDIRDFHGSGRGPNVVMLHGLYASAGVWRPLRKSLSARLDSVDHTFSYVPGPGIVELSSRLASFIDEIESESPIHLVGHSLGGLVLRHYVAQPGCDRRVVQTISLAAPFCGTPKSWLVPGQAGRDLEAGALILGELRAASIENRRLHHLTLIGEEDGLIASSDGPNFGERSTIAGVGHNGILFNEDTIMRVVSRIEECLQSS